MPQWCLLLDRHRHHLPAQSGLRPSSKTTLFVPVKVT
jgi:hypothetical protein